MHVEQQLGKAAPVRDDRGSDPVSPPRAADARANGSTSVDETEAGIRQILREQSAYYDARASEYDDVWYRRGRYDLGAAGNERWFAETARLEAFVDTAEIAGDVLELACGTGLFTKRLARRAARLTALDMSPRVLAINAARVDDPSVVYSQADVFGWEPPEGRLYDAIFFGFFMSHIPPHRLDAFWERLERWLAPGGRVWFCDDAPGVDERPSNPGESVADGPDWAHRRTLHDGRSFTIVKICHEPETLTDWLAARGWRADIATTGEEFIFGWAAPAADVR
jgi:demethylmenaquinone methyltransferase/2-methoxy-6-polyprenyl-1,4-benzoquinol methylase